MRRTHKSNQSQKRIHNKRHRFEHWYRDRQVYFITARIAHRLPAFAPEPAKHVFWAAFDRYTAEAGFTPWITSLLDNHYHTLGYLETGLNLPKMMQGLHGVTAKKVNDLIEAGVHQAHFHEAGGLKSTRPSARLTQRIRPFWSESGKKTYFDGLIRDASQARKAYRYIQIQPTHHHATATPESYPHTHTQVPLDQALTSARSHHAYLEGVPYKRYRYRLEDGII